MMQLFTRFAADSCSSFLGFPTWYKYIHPPGDCSTIHLKDVNDIWLVIAAIIEILLRVAGMFAVAFVIYGGFRYITSQAEPEAVTKARQTIVSALIGLIISIVATVLINFIAGSVN